MCHYDLVMTLENFTKVLGMLQGTHEINLVKLMEVDIH